MIPALTSLKGLIKRNHYIDHAFFRLHYQSTVCLLLAFCLLLTAKILFGDVIDCHNRMLEARDSFYDNWCFSRGTFTEYVIDHDAYKQAIRPKNVSRASAQVLTTTTESPGYIDALLVYLGDKETVTQQTPKENSTTIASPEEVSYPVDENPFPMGLFKGTAFGDQLKNHIRRIHKFVKNRGVRSSPNLVYLIPGVVIPRGRKEKGLLTFWHYYYQYMPIILFVQAILFYFPHYLWKCWEGGVVSSVCKRLQENRFSPSSYLEANQHLVDYLQNSFLRKRSLVYKYYFCHILLLANLIMQIIALNVIFNNQFVTYGFDVLEYYFIDEDIYGMRDYYTGKPGGLNNPMDFVFPKVTTCTYLTLSAAGGSPNDLSFSCVLPLNIFHDKFFLILWFWFAILTLLTISQIIYDIMYATLPILRRRLFTRRFGPISPRHPASLPELFLLDLIGTNCDRFAFTALLSKLRKEE